MSHILYIVICIHKVTRRSILGSDGMTKSDCSLSLWLISECSLSILWVPSEYSLNACLMLLESSWRHPEDILKTSWKHHEESEAERWRLSALEHFVPNGQTDGQTHRHCDFLSSCWSQQIYLNNCLCPAPLCNHPCNDSVSTEGKSSQQAAALSLVNKWFVLIVCYD